MIIKEEKIMDVSSNDTSSDMEISIDLENSLKLFNILIESYKNPRSSLVREYTSNAWDANAIVGKNNVPVVVKIDEDEAGWYIEFIDEGVGMTYNFFRTTFSKLLKSTKEKTNEQIGGFGIGSKTALSYTNYFYITSAKQGRRNQFAIFRESSRAPKITKLKSEKCSLEDTGTSVKVYFNTDKYTERSEIDNFCKICTAELAYFDNVIFKFKNNSSYNNSYNNSKIIEGKYFKYKKDDVLFESHNTHMVLGKVRYNIDYKELGLDSSDYRTNVAIKFEIGELQVHMNRETVIYTDECKKLIKERLELAYDELAELYNKTKTPNTDYRKYLTEVKNDTDGFKLLPVKVSEFSTNYIALSGKAMETRLKPITYLYNNLLGITEDKKSLLQSSYKLGKFSYFKSIINNKLVREHNITTDKLTFINHLKGKTVLIAKTAEEYERLIKNKYLVKFFNGSIIILDDYFTHRADRSETDSVNIRYVRKDTTIRESTKRVFILGEYKKELALKKVFLAEINKVANKVIRVTKDVNPDSEWMAREKLAEKLARQGKTKKLEGEISAVTYSRYADNTKHRTTLMLETFKRFKGIIVYGFREDDSLLQKTVNLLKNKRSLSEYDNSFIVIQIAKNNESLIINNFKNAVNVNIFLMSENRILIKLYTNWLIKDRLKLILSNDNIRTMDKINKNIAKKLRAISDYLTRSGFNHGV